MRSFGATKFGDLIHCGMAVAENIGDEAVLALIEGFHQWVSGEMARIVSAARSVVCQIVSPATAIESAA